MIVDDVLTAIFRLQFAKKSLVVFNSTGIVPLLARVASAIAAIRHQLRLLLLLMSPI